MNHYTICPHCNTRRIVLTTDKNTTLCGQCFKEYPVKEKLTYLEVKDKSVV